MDDERLSDLLGRADPPDAVDQVLLPALVDEAGGDVGVGLLQGLDNLSDCKSVRSQSLGQQCHFELTTLASGHDDLRDTRDGEQPSAHREVGVGPSIHGRRPLARGDGKKEHFAHDRGDGGEHRRLDIVRQRITHELELLAHDLAGAKHLCSPLELGVDDRDSHAGAGANAANAGRTVQGGFDGQCDARLELLRRHAVGLGDDRHRGSREIGEDIYRHAGCGVAAPEEHRSREHQDRNAMRERPAKNGVDHAGSFSVRGRGPGWNRSTRRVSPTRRRASQRVRPPSDRS